MSWLAVLDMDGTILEHRTVDVLCEELGLTKELETITETSVTLTGYEVTSSIARLFQGHEVSELERIFDRIPFVPGIAEFAKFLKSRNFVSSIVTDSYTFLASRVANRLQIDTVRGNQLEIIEGMVTGRIVMPLGWEKRNTPNCQKKAICKLSAMEDLASKYSISEDRTLAIGDSRSDFCMVCKAAIGIAIRPKDEIIAKAADVVIQTDFLDLQIWLECFLDRLTD